MELTQEHRLTVVEDRSLRNEGRIKKLEGEHEVDTLEDKPAQRSEIPDTEAPGEATAEDYQSALREMGVEV